MAGPPDSIFRAEALEALAKGAGAGDVLRISPRWASATYWLVLAFVVGGVGYCAVARIDEYASAEGVVEGQGVVAYVPGKFRRQIRVGLPLRFDSDEGPRDLVIDDVVDAAGSVRVRAQSGALPSGTTGHVSIRLRRRSILATFIPALGEHDE